jgi:GT2 family glycosyltransferase
MGINKVKIDVMIPYEPGGKLGWDYNRIMKEAKHDWVLLLDHDVFLSLNPNWYHICQQVIENEKNVGIFTCKTNAHHSNTGQQDPDAPESNDILEHIEFSRKIWDRYQYSCSDMGKISGFFMLVNKIAWQKAGGFPGKAMFKEDWGFSRKVKQAGYRLSLINGLYVYHLKKRIGSFIDGIDTTKEVKAKRDAK